MADNQAGSKRKGQSMMDCPFRLPAGSRKAPGTCQVDGGLASSITAGRLLTNSRAATIPASYSTISGMARISCENTSGGVTTAEITNAPTITYGRISFNFLMVTTFMRTSSTTTIG